MTFQNLEYFAFLGIVWVVWLGIVPRPRHPRVAQVVLLGASYAFYATWSPRFLVVLLASSLFNAVWGVWLRRRPTASMLWGGLAANIALLGTYKYAGWILSDLHRQSTIFYNLAVPVGLSFYTFQAISYPQLTPLPSRGGQPVNSGVLPVYGVLANRHLGSGVSVRRDGRAVSPPRGADRRRCGDRPLPHRAGSRDENGPGGHARDGAGGGVRSRRTRLSRAPLEWDRRVDDGDRLQLQLFFDFAGYSHIVIGSARLFGIRLRENFRAPYLSTTPTEFWTVAHVAVVLDPGLRVFLVGRSTPQAVVAPSLACDLDDAVRPMAWCGAGSSPGARTGVLLVGHRLIQPRPARAAPPPPVVAASWVVVDLISLGWVFATAGSLQARS